MKSVTMVLSTIMICFFAFTLSEANDITDNLALALSFEEGAGNITKDFSPEGNNGKLQGNPQWIDGKFGKALYFDSKSSVTTPYINLKEKSFTIQLWIKPNMTTEQEIVFSQYESSSINLTLHLRIYNNGTVLFGFYSNDLNTPIDALKKGEWYNLTFIFDISDKSRKIYIDGQKVAGDVSASAYLGSKGETRIGGWERPDKVEFYQSYGGAIDEVRVWFRPLNNDEILESMDTKISVESLGKSTTTWGLVKQSF
jgi:hypothetical protein